MSDATNDRKLRHLEIIAADRETDRRQRHFDALRLKHRALPELDLQAVDTTVSFMGKRLAFPLLISSMTGGNHEVVRTINRNLAQAAEQTGVALAVGSQRVMFSDPQARESFALRPFAPTTLLFGNLGAVQLNCGFGLAACREALQVLEADALYLHLNPLQEAIQPHGNTNFAGLASKIRDVCAGLERPVILKEVGAGISVADATLALDCGIRYLDVAGAGGTSWSRIEHHQRLEADGHDIGLLFQDWGIPTPAALKALAPLRDRLTLIASGGLRHGLDMAKAMILGASLCGLAAPFLPPAMESVERVVELIRRLQREFATTMFLLGVGRVADLTGQASLLAES